MLHQDQNGHKACALAPTPEQGLYLHHIQHSSQHAIHITSVQQGFVAGTADTNLQGPSLAALCVVCCPTLYSQQHSHATQQHLTTQTHCNHTIFCHHLSCLVSTAWLTARVAITAASHVWLSAALDTQHPVNSPCAYWSAIKLWWLVLEAGRSRAPAAVLTRTAAPGPPGTEL